MRSPARYDVGLGDTETVDPLPDDVDGLVDAGRCVGWPLPSTSRGVSVTLVPPCRSSPSLGLVCAADEHESHRATTNSPSSAPSRSQIGRVLGPRVVRWATR